MRPPRSGKQPDIILARLEVDYLRQLYYRVGEVLTVRSWVARIGTKSFTVRQDVGHGVEPEHHRVGLTRQGVGEQPLQQPRGCRG